jgi:hypothetical protein
MKSTQYYDEHAARLSAFSNAIDSGVVHRSWIEKYLPEKPGFACDVGAGSGRDTNWLASRSWDVVGRWSLVPTCASWRLTAVTRITKQFFSPFPIILPH